MYQRATGIANTLRRCACALCLHFASPVSAAVESIAAEVVAHCSKVGLLAHTGPLSNDRVAVADAMATARSTR
eukprot:763318-Hanusia_phi.AAC.19